MSPTTVWQIQREAVRAATINAVQAALTDTTKAVTAEILADLVSFAKGRDSLGNLLADKTDWDLKGLAQREANHLVAVQQLTTQVAAHAQTLEVLANQLTHLRAYLQVGTAEQLATAVAAGKSVPIAEATLTEAQRLAIERAKAHQTPVQGVTIHN